MAFAKIFCRCVAQLLLLGVFLLPFSAHECIAAPKKGATVHTVYDNQPVIQEKEFLSFLTLLPAFRKWARTNQEEAHPTLTNGRPDFRYSPKAASWVQQHGFEPRRFFCIMGKMAAALVITEEGHDLYDTKPRDMPNVSKEETALAQKHLGRMLEAGGAAAPSVTATAPTLPKRAKFEGK